MPNHNQAGNPLPSPSEVMNRFGNEVRAPRFIGGSIRGFQL